MSSKILFRDKAENITGPAWSTVVEVTILNTINKRLEIRSSLYFLRRNQNGINN